MNWIKIEKEEDVPIGVTLLFWDKREGFLPLVGKVHNDSEYGLCIDDFEQFSKIVQFSHYCHIIKP